MYASWPQHEGIDESYLKASSYIADSAHEFRLRIKSMMTAKGKKVGYWSDMFDIRLGVSYTLYD